jgi:ferric-dicitrate binding protein FerR (iron transport regulator)
MTPERIERALLEATREARSEPLPHVDWPAIEDQLPMTRVRTVPPRRLNLRRWLLAASFAAAGVALGLALRQPGPHAAAVAHSNAGTAPAPATRSAAEDLDGDALQPGARVAAGDLPQTVVHAGHARWTLAPHSAGTLLANGDVVTIRLERGSVTSRVTKSSKSETFAVEAADVRVAAHGTEFVVSLGADGVSVSVTEGSVLVGPREERGAGQLLISPAARRYSLAGVPAEDDRGLEALGARPTRSRTAADEPTASASASAASRLALEAGLKKDPAKRAAPVAAATGTSAEEEEDPRPTEPSADGLERTTTSVMRLTQACFKQRTIAGEGVRVTAQTSVTFRTLPQGGVNRVVFEPPLSPAVQACVNAGQSAIQTEATRNGFQASRTLELER